MDALSSHLNEGEPFIRRCCFRVKVSESSTGATGIRASDLNTAANILIVGFLGVLALYYLKVILLPLSVAIILYMLILPSEKYLFDKIKNPILVYGTMASIAFLAAYAVSTLLYSNLTIFIDEELPMLQVKMDEKLQAFSEYTFNGVELGSATSLVENAVTDDRINDFATWLLKRVGSILSSSLTVFVLLVFLILEGDSFPGRLKAAKPELFVKMERIVGDSSDAVNNYILVRFFISISQAVVCAIIMLIFGIPGVLIWAILYAILEWIPVIGATVATAFPAIVGILVLEPAFALIMIILLLVNCGTFASFIEPRVAGERLGLSPMVLILSLMGWGVLWGPVGLITGPVLTVVVRIILEESETTKPLAIMLSAQDYPE